MHPASQLSVLALVLLEYVAVSAPNLSPTERRIVALRLMLDRWRAELPAVQAVDPVRARDHVQALVDLQQLIDSLESERQEASLPAVFEHS